MIDCIVFNAVFNSISVISEGKGEIACNKQFILFPRFLPSCRTLDHLHETYNCRLQSLSVKKSLKFVAWERVKL